ncbi:hypothetical protein AVEN_176459-1 [Araneus ventricosus]|uniref:Uncharacterized protein n=1 Tax=Araneus ventricosus TaxID=182803 RepID=A0A4Y2TP64_ARAVE|nr:hypothetical protein AVEN_176459-1 [Araneus ventricosus]
MASSMAAHLLQLDFLWHLHGSSSASMIPYGIFRWQLICFYDFYGIFHGSSSASMVSYGIFMAAHLCFYDFMTSSMTHHQLPASISNQLICTAERPRTEGIKSQRFRTSRMRAITSGTSNQKDKGILPDR